MQIWKEISEHRSSCHTIMVIKTVIGSSDTPICIPVIATTPRGSKKSLVIKQVDLICKFQGTNDKNIQKTSGWKK